MIHVLKCWPVSFEPIINGFKTFEIRKNDRPYNVGDTLILREFEPCPVCLGTGTTKDFMTRQFVACERCDGDRDHGKFGNRYCKCLVAHTLPGGQFGIEKGYIAMSIIYMAFGFGDWQENDQAETLPPVGDWQENECKASENKGVKGCDPSKA